MDNFFSVLSSMIIPILVVVGIVVRMVNAANKKTPPPQHPPVRQPGMNPQNTYRPMPSPVQNRTVPAMTGSAQAYAPNAYSARPSSLDGAILEGSPLNRSTLESSPLNRQTLEGTSLEGGDSPFGRSFGERTAVENRMEGGVTPAAYHVSRTSRNMGKGQVRKSIFTPSRNTLIQGIIYAEILGKPGGRRASR